MSRRACFIFLFALVLTGLLPSYAQAAANGKHGHIDYRRVGSACHKAETGNTISPNTHSMAASKAYRAARRHTASDKANQKLSDYASTNYRDSVKNILIRGVKV